MTFARILLTVLGALLAQPGLAGPWPRDEGTQFLSLSIEADRDAVSDQGQGVFGGLYYERGLRNALTFGLDLGSETTEDPKAIAFLRWPVGRRDGRSRLAVEVGAGLYDGKGAVRPGLSWGRGIMRGQIPGWLSVDSRLVLQSGLDGLLETDVTFGLKPTDHTMVILQLQTGQPGTGDFYAKIAPSWVYQYRPGRRVELGLVAGVTGNTELRLKLGLWREF
ncbi:MAG: hypothetical protein AAGA28_15840 [Pseudomonadota bacterium]